MDYERFMIIAFFFFYMVFIKLLHVKLNELVKSPHFNITNRPAESKAALSKHGRLLTYFSCILLFQICIDFVFNFKSQY